MNDRETILRRSASRLSGLSTRIFCALILVLMCSPCPGPAVADYTRTIGPGEATTILPLRDRCSGALEVHHDSSFEAAHAWEGAGAWPEYYGAWGEAYDFGPCQVVCGAYWLTTTPWIYQGDPATLYVWEGGLTGEPGAVLRVVPDVHFPNVPYWPQIGENDVPVELEVEGEFTIGFWGDWSSQVAAFFIAVDQNGGGGHPWTYVAPEIGYPAGWHHPVDAGWHDCVSLGIGVYYTAEPTPANATSWSRVKRLFR